MKYLLQLFRKSLGLQILMVLSFLVTGVIVAFAVHTNNMNEKALESALEEEVCFASWVYNTTAEESLKKSAYQTLKAVLLSVEQNDRQLTIGMDPKRFNQIQKEGKEAECVKNYLKPIQGIFVYDPDSGQIESRSAGNEVGEAFGEWAKSEIENASPAKGRLYSKLYTDENEKEYAVFYARSPGLSPLNRELIFGVKTDVKNLKSLFKDIWEKGEIIPASVTGN